MYSSFTNGRVLDVPDMCGYCDITTGGEHEGGCSLFPAPNQIEEVEVRILTSFSCSRPTTAGRYVVVPTRKLTYPDHVAIERLLNKRHPEWGRKEIKSAKHLFGNRIRDAIRTIRRHP